MKKYLLRNNYCVNYHLRSTLSILFFILFGVTQHGFGRGTLKSPDDCTNPATVDAGVDIRVCSNYGSATLYAIVGGSATSVVSWTGGAGTYNYPNFPDLSVLEYTPDPSENGTVVTLTVTTDDPDGPCTAATDQVDITVDAPFIVDAGIDIRVCVADGSVSLSGLVGGGATAAQWSGGLGTFSDINNLNSDYTPAPAEAGTIAILYLTPIAGDNVCPVIPGEVWITVDPQPTAYAGSDLSSCSGGLVTLASDGGVTNATGVQWTGGLGIFSPDANTLNATYTPDLSEINSVVTLTLTTTNTTNVCAAVSSDVNITVSQVIVDASPDIRTCEDGTVSLSGLVLGGASTGHWVGGLGVFDPDRQTLNANYTPDPSEAGTTVTLTLVSDATVSCPSVTDDINISVDQLPSVDAGIDISTCVNGTVTLSGISSGGTASVLWSGGAGVFSDPTSLTSDYTPHPSEAGSIVTLTLTGYGASGSVCAPSFAEVSITVDRVPTADAGSDQSICNNDIVALSGSITDGTGTGIWSTSGDGVFDNNLSLTPVYTPGTNDRSTGLVTLTLTPDPLGFCAVNSAFVDIYIRPVISANETIVNTSCTGGDGSITLNPTGSDGGPYSYLWNGGSNSNQISSLIANDYTVTVSDGSGCTSSFTYTILAPLPSACTVTLNMNVFIQGYYLGAGQMNSVLLNSSVSGATITQCDTVEVSLMNSTYPYAIATTIKGILKTDGTISLVFPASGIYGNDFYIRILHRNALETWSAAPITMNTITSYDFTSSDTQAYGSTQVEVEPGVWALWSGDLNQDGFVESADYGQIENDLLLFQIGYYNSDITGDGFVESADYGLMENNLILFIIASHPY